MDYSSLPVPAWVVAVTVIAILLLILMGCMAIVSCCKLRAGSLDTDRLIAAMTGGKVEPADPVNSDQEETDSHVSVSSDV